MVKEQVPRRANCKIDLYVTTVRELSGRATTSIGGTTAVIQTEALSVELDIFVAASESIPYELIIGKTVLANGDLQMLTDTDGIYHKATLCVCGDRGDAEHEKNSLCCNTLGDIDDKTRDALAERLYRYKHMIATGSNRYDYDFQIKIDSFRSLKTC